MEIEPDRQVSATSINYEDQPIVQAQIDGVDYRVDTGLGSAVAISSREAGTWAWTPVAEGRWDGRRLRASAFALRDARHRKRDGGLLRVRA